MKAIFLEKDGTLVEDLPSDVALSVEPRRIRLASGVGPALRLLARLDYRLFVVSHQLGIAHRRFSDSAMQAIGDRLSDLLFRENLILDGLYYCPHHDCPQHPLGTVAPCAVACH